MLAQITSAFSESGVNIDNLANGSKGDVAYTIVEIMEKASESIVRKIQAVENVMKVYTY